jgi:hypothetical protein
LSRIIAAVFAVAMILIMCVSADAAPSLYDRARNLYDIHEYKVALILFERVIAQEPDNGEAWDFASWCRRYLGDWEAARVGFEKAEKLLTGDAGKWVKVGLGETYLGAGVYDKAIEAFGEAISLAPGDDELVVRSLKGIVIANANLPNEAGMNDALAKLGEKSKSEADNLRAQVAEMLRAALSAKDESKSAQTERKSTSDSADREKAAMKDVASSRDDASSSHAQGTVWGLFTLGDPMSDVLASLQKRGIEVNRIDEGGNQGLWIYRITLPDALKISVLDGGAKSDAYYCLISEFDGRLLSVELYCGWFDRSNNLTLKNEIFERAAAVLGKEFGSVKSSETGGLYAESIWVKEREQVVALRCAADLEGDLIMNVSYYDLPGMLLFLR